MAKYYIQSGAVSVVVTARDIEGAAMWVLHRTIEALVDLYELDDEESVMEPTLIGLSQFGPKILCSEIGFGRSEAGVLDTDRMFRTWQQLMAAADRLFDQFS